MYDQNSNQADIVEKEVFRNKTGRVIFILTVVIPIEIEDCQTRFVK